MRGHNPAHKNVKCQQRCGSDAVNEEVPIATLTNLVVEQTSIKPLFRGFVYLYSVFTNESLLPYMKGPLVGWASKVLTCLLER